MPRSKSNEVNLGITISTDTINIMFFTPLMLLSEKMGRGREMSGVLEPERNPSEEEEEEEEERESMGFLQEQLQ